MSVDSQTTNLNILLHQKMGWFDPEGSLNKVLGHNEKVDGVGIGPGLHGAFEMLMGDEIKGAGSFVSADKREGGINMDEFNNFKNLKEIRKRFWAGAYNNRELGIFTKVALDTYISRSGPNADIVGTEQLGNIDETNENLLKLVKLSARVMLDTGERAVALTNWYDRFKFIHIEFTHSSGNGGINFVVLPDQKDLLPEQRDQHNSMLSMRMGQNASFIMGEDGMTVHRDVAIFEDGNMEMTRVPQSLGEYLRYASRAIKIMATHDIDSQRIDVESFILKLANSKENSSEISYEDAIGMMDALSVAHDKNPELTEHLLVVLGINQFIANLGDDDNIKNLFVNADMELMGKDQPEGKKMSDYMLKIMKFSPFSIDEWSKKTPTGTPKIMGEKVDNGKVKSYGGPYVEGNALDTYADAAIVMYKMADLAESKGLKHKAVLIRKDADMAWKMATIGV